MMTGVFVVRREMYGEVELVYYHLEAERKKIRVKFRFPGNRYTVQLFRPKYHYGKSSQLKSMDHRNL